MALDKSLQRKIHTQKTSHLEGDAMGQARDLHFGVGQGRKRDRNTDIWIQGMWTPSYF